MNFTKYTSIDNSYNNKLLAKIVSQINPNTPLVALEKVHGANFSVTLDCVSDTVKFAKRSGFIEPNESFYSYGNIKDTLEANVRVFKKLVNDTSKVITVYGEICGGWYDGVQDPHTQRVQKEVQYSPSTEFIAFDLMVDGEYLPYVSAKLFCEAAGFKFAPEIQRGFTIDKIYEVNEKFLSKVPELLGITHVIENNFAEGVVIRPYFEEITLGNGNRFILKKKTEAFTEKESVAKPFKAAVEYSPQVTTQIKQVLPYVNQIRLSNVLSKEGSSFSGKDFSRILGLFVQDIFNDFNKDEYGCEGGLKDLYKKEDWKQISGAVQVEAAKELKKVWADYCEG